MTFENENEIVYRWRGLPVPPLSIVVDLDEGIPLQLNLMNQGIRYSFQALAFQYLFNFENEADLTAATLLI